MLYTEKSVLRYYVRFSQIWSHLKGKKCALLGYVLTQSNINTYKKKRCIYMQKWFLSSILDAKCKILITTIKLNERLALRIDLYAMQNEVRPTKKTAQL